MENPYFRLAMLTQWWVVLEIVFLHITAFSITYQCELLACVLRDNGSANGRYVYSKNWHEQRGVRRNSILKFTSSGLRIFFFAQQS